MPVLQSSLDQARDDHEHQDQDVDTCEDFVYDR